MLFLLAKGNDLREHIVPLVMLAVLGWLYRDAPKLVPHTVKFARCGIVTVRHPQQSGWLDELGRLKGGRR
jgi:hypothetical protein